eukprot:CAMPEP_0202831528 /NCGR_PEP_ID=MMETSP1389-20130828/16920_1 /ASSEMBLY_ACC=CAM_ASM_000865 /TAXON_ID=302021 /ORGANISM="Rhodomonas sp., Strain CCMP768" /LENGTH=101 /DNA_ID=CAMNT_0049505287 /DNA_START=24 /DNA_END=329 /DNA_ORIENTATION=+
MTTQCQQLIIDESARECITRREHVSCIRGKMTSRSTVWAVQSNIAPAGLTIPAAQNENVLHLLANARTFSPRWTSPGLLAGAEQTSMDYPDVDSSLDFWVH